MLIIFGMILELSIFHLWLTKNGLTTLQYVEQQRVKTHSSNRRVSAGRNESQKAFSVPQSNENNNSGKELAIDLQNKSMIVESKTATTAAVDQSLVMSLSRNVIAFPNANNEIRRSKCNCRSCCCCCKEDRQTVFAIKD